MRLSDRQTVYLQTMGIDIWREQGVQISTADGEQPSADHHRSKTDPTHNETAHCAVSGISHDGIQMVRGQGNIDADWMIISEASGVDEEQHDSSGESRADQLLNNILKAIGLERDQVFIAEFLKCCPAYKHGVEPPELVKCQQYFAQQIKTIKPKIILVFGHFAAQNFLQQESSIGQMRGQCFEYSDSAIPVIVCYHPDYLLRSPKEKHKTWQDLSQAKSLFEQMK